MPEEVSRKTVSISESLRLVWAMAFSNSKSPGLRKPLKIKFDKKTSGEVESFTIYQGGQENIAKKIE